MGFWKRSAIQKPVALRYLRVCEAWNRVEMHCYLEDGDWKADDVVEDEDASEAYAAAVEVEVVVTETDESAASRQNPHGILQKNARAHHTT